MNKRIPRGVAWKLALAGLCAGIVNGLLGAGGGIIVVFAIARLLPEIASDKNGAFATALCVMLPVSVLSAIVYSSRGHMSLDGFGIFILPAVIGGAVGGFLLGKLGSSMLNRLFAALIAVSGIILIIR